MKFNKHNSYRQGRVNKPICPKCRSSANTVQLRNGFRCIYCQIEFGKNELKGQQKLI